MAYVNDGISFRKGLITLELSPGLGWEGYQNGWVGPIY